MGLDLDSIRSVDPDQMGIGNPSPNLGRDQNWPPKKGKSEETVCLKNLNVLFVGV
jgi:hypothetical protein